MALSKIDPAGLDIGQIGGRRNLIINGGQTVWQRGTSNTNFSNDTIICDRWKGFANGLGASGSVQKSERSTDAPDGFKYAQKISVTTAGGLDTADNYFGVGTKLEHQDISHIMDNNTVTLSFYVKSSLATTYGITAQRFNQSEPSSGRNTYVANYTINTANTWERKTITIPTDSTTTGETDNAQGLILAWVLDVKSGGTRDDATLGWNDSTATIQVNSAAVDTGFYDTTNNWAITGVQLEVGSVATPFEHRSFGEEIQLCKRYYQTSGSGATGGQVAVYGRGNGTASSVAWLPLPVQMRSSPTSNTNISSTEMFSVAGYGAGTATVSAYAGTNRGMGAYLLIGGLSGGTDNRPNYVVFSSELTLDAEL